MLPDSDYALGNVELYKKFFELKARYVMEDKIDEQFAREKLIDDASCYAGLCSMSIDPFGNVRPCLSYPETFGSVRKDNVATLWERARNFPLKNRFMRNITTHCNNCKYLGQCRVCVADLLNKNNADHDDCGNILLMAQAAASVAK